MKLAAHPFDWFAWIFLSRLGAGIEQQNDGSSVNVSVNVEEPAAAEEDKVAPTDGAATDGDNGTAAPATDSQAGSDDKPLEAAAEAPQPESDAAAVAQEISRMIEVPNSRVYY